MPVFTQRQTSAREEWLGGAAGGPASVDVLRSLLTSGAQPPFAEIAEFAAELPFAIREQARRFQHGVSQVMFFQKQ